MDISGASIERVGRAGTDPSFRVGPDVALKVEGLAKAFGKHQVLRQISLAVRAGEIVGLLGRDGAGKTLCFDLIMGFARPDAGCISLRGTDVTELPVEQRARLGLSCLPQQASIFRDLTVEQNIRIVLEFHEPQRSARAERLEEILQEFQLVDLRQMPAIHLSGGERRRCEIARAVAASPSVLLLDEPFAGIDPIAAREIQRTLLNLKARTVGLLVSDQNLPEMFAIMDRVCVLHEGRILFEGSPEEMLADARVRRFYLGEISAGNLVDRVAAQSGDGAGVAIRPQGPESAGRPPRDGRINDLGAGADARPGPERVPGPPEKWVRGFANHPASVAVRAVPFEKECSDEPVRSA